jgi:hypothetical protein
MNLRHGKGFEEYILEPIHFRAEGIGSIFCLVTGCADGDDGIAFHGIIVDIGMILDDFIIDHLADLALIS